MPQRIGGKKSKDTSYRKETRFAYFFSVTDPHTRLRSKHPAPRTE